MLLHCESKNATLHSSITATNVKLIFKIRPLSESART